MERKLQKRLKGGYWYGIAYRPTISETGEQKIKESWYRLLTAGGDRLTTDASERTVDRALHLLQQKLLIEKQAEQFGRQSDLAFLDLAKRFIEIKEHDTRRSTVRNYRLWIGRFCEMFGDLAASDIRGEHIERFKKELATANRPATVNTALRCLRTLLNWAVNQEALNKSPMAHVAFVHLAIESATKCMSWEIFQRVVLPAIQLQRHRTALCLAMYAGLRREEICHLRWEHIDFENEVIILPSGEAFETKSGRGRKIPLYPPLRRELEATKHVSPFVVGSSKAVPDGSAISHAWLRVLRALNSSRTAAEQIPEIRLHELRGSFCTELLQRLQPVIVQKIMGHADIQTTMRHYAHLSSDIAVEAAKKISL